MEPRCLLVAVSTLVVALAGGSALRAQFDPDYYQGRRYLDDLDATLGRMEGALTSGSGGLDAADGWTAPLFQPVPTRACDGDLGRLEEAVQPVFVMSESKGAGEGFRVRVAQLAELAARAFLAARGEPRKKALADMVGPVRRTRALVRAIRFRNLGETSPDAEPFAALPDEQRRRGLAALVRLRQHLAAVRDALLAQAGDVAPGPDAVFGAAPDAFGYLQFRLSDAVILTLRDDLDVLWAMHEPAPPTALVDALDAVEELWNYDGRTPVG